MHCQANDLKKGVVGLDKSFVHIDGDLVAAEFAIYLPA